MKHYSFEEWQKYVRDEVSNNQRDEIESHLYACDECLTHYLQAVEANESSLPILENDSHFTDLVMADIAKTKPKKEAPFYQKAAFHYLLAAAATLLLTFTGVFHSITIFTGGLDHPQTQAKKPSLTEGVINKTFAWMDSLENKGGKQK